jgi:hypothetical protein
VNDFVFLLGCRLVVWGLESVVAQYNSAQPITMREVRLRLVMVQVSNTADECSSAQHRTQGAALLPMFCAFVLKL